MDEALYLSYKAIAIFKNAAAEIAPLAEFLCARDRVRRIELCARIFGDVYASGSSTTGEWIRKAVERDGNAFSRAAACGERIPDRIKAQIHAELLTFKRLSLVRPEDVCGDDADVAPKFVCGGFSLTYDKLVRFYAAESFGKFSHGSAFVYRNGALTPVFAEPIRLADLKNYAEEKAEIVKNTENFLNGLPAFHTLLYGDRGTGKSSTVRAIAYEFRDRLKTIELGKNDIRELPALYAELRGLKQKFVLFVDDLGFDESDGGADELKAALEGSLDSGAPNAILYCTSNRRHLIKETDKSWARSAEDERQAELALFDRFGLVVTYLNPSRDEFIDILKQIMRSRGMKWRDEYAQIAELSALKKGGRSPRAAKQIADLIESTYVEKRGE